MKRINFRKQYIINKKFQYSVIGYSSMLALAIITISYLSIEIFFINIQNEALRAGLDKKDIFFTYLYEQKSVSNKIFLAASFVTVLVVLLGGVFISHKIAGPLYRLRQHLMNSNKSTLTPIKFRKNDYFKDIEDEFNKFVERE